MSLLNYKSRLEKLNKLSDDLDRLKGTIEYIYTQSNLIIKLKSLIFNSGSFARTIYLNSKRLDEIKSLLEKWLKEDEQEIVNILNNIEK